MPASSKKHNVSHKLAKRQHPYSQPSERQQTRSTRLTSSTNGAESSTEVPATPSSIDIPAAPATTPTASRPFLPSSSAPISPLPATRAARAPHTIRDLSLRVIRKKYPYFTPRNDWELLLLSNAPYTGQPQGIYKFLESELAYELQERTLEKAIQDAKAILDEAADCTGMKPEPGDPHVFVHPIPNSQYSIRLFPGSVEGRDYCLDFLVTSTGQPVNSPFKFDLLCIPDPDAPVPSGPIVRMRPLECAFGIPEDKIDPGEEKFLLREGQHCVLRRPGHRDVRFTVPIRRRPEPARQPADADYLHFPQYVG
ncbi:hypothetical protein OH77DRAFT_1425381 [Trametes cingulata]|nr:hypothetical protein OH77DRAFT_1425381 [Trametes cingulata]